MKQKNSVAYGRQKQPQHTLTPSGEIKEKCEDCKMDGQDRCLCSPFQHVSPKYMTIKQWVTAYGFIPEGGIRHLIFSNDIFNRKVVKRLGSKILLDVQALDDFVEEQNSNNGRK